MKYFSIKELCKSDTAIRKGIDNHPTPEAEANLTRLVDEVLDKIRDKFGRPISVSSGYRCPKLNAAVGGAKTSYHLKGCAADLYCKTNAMTKEVFDIARKMFPKELTELLFERSGSTIWVHIAFDPSSSKHYYCDNYVVK